MLDIRPTLLALGFLLPLSTGLAVERPIKPTFDSAVVIVDFDDQSERMLGRTWGRAYLADMTKYLVKQGAHSVVIKMFIDAPGEASVDQQLENAVGAGRVILQASISSVPPVTSSLSARFAYTGRFDGTDPLIKGDAGWLPTPGLQRNATKICFADVTDAHLAPLVERFVGELYKSLYVCVLEEMLRSELTSVERGKAIIGKWQLRSNDSSSVRVSLSRTSFLGALKAEQLLLDQNVDVRGKVAIVTYSGSKSPTVVANGMAIKVHQAFVAGLRDLFDQVELNDETGRREGQ